ncbi:MAG: galactose oxidase [Prolixibacteraceae bacterium]|nr:galactose oxidase [Prolixibacteraceae bacterium]
MRTLRTMTLGLLLLAACNSTEEDPLGNWVKKSDFEGLPRGSAVSFVIDDKAYVGLGYNDDDDDEYLNDFWVYSISTDSWDKVADFPGAGRTAAVSFTINGKGYVGTGFDGNNKLSDIWEYDPTKNKWTQKDNFLGGARYKAVAFALNNYGYIGTGYGDDSTDKIDFYRFDPTAAAGSQWVKVQSIGGSKRRGATAFTYNGKAYVCTGINNGVTLTDMWEYDPSANTWTKKVDLDDDDDWAIVRQNASSFVLDGKAYVFLGEKSGTLSDVWEYDFSADTWTVKTDFEGAARVNAVSFTVGSKAILTTGQSGSYYLDDVWEFRPFEEYDEYD